MKYLKEMLTGVLKILGGVTVEAFKTFITFATIGYLTMQPVWYRQFARRCDEIWNALWDVAATISGPNSWLMTIFSWVDLASKGGFVVRIILVGALWTMVFFLLGQLIKVFRRG